MGLTSKSAIKNLLKQRGLRPSKRLGQNFLVDKGAVRKIIKAADLQPVDTVLEIGPGPGILTEALAKKAKRVIAVEKDPQMVEILKAVLKDFNFNNVEIIQKDIRNWKLEIRNSYKVVANLPFYLTAPVIRQLLERTEARPLYAVLVVQKEVGQRICARPPRMNLLAVSVQFYGEPEIISYIPKKSFWPSPEVDATIIKIIPHNNVAENPTIAGKMTTPNFSNLFFEVVKAGFSQPRKQLINNLSRGLKINKKTVREWLLTNNIQPSQRAETLSLINWANLTKTFTAEP